MQGNETSSGPTHLEYPEGGFANFALTPTSVSDPNRGGSSLTAPERETVITVSDADDVVHIWTARRKDITRLRKKSAVATEVESGFHGGTEYAVFTVPVDRWNIGAAARPKRQMTDEQRQVAAERLRKIREESK